MLVQQENTFICNLATETQHIAAINETIRRPLKSNCCHVTHLPQTHNIYESLCGDRFDIILLLLSPLPVTKARDEMAASSRLPTILCSKEALWLWANRVSGRRSCDQSESNNADDWALFYVRRRSGLCGSRSNITG